MVTVKRTDIRLHADPKKVILKYLNFGNPERMHSVAQYVQGLEEAAAQARLDGIMAEFEARHFDLKAAFKAHYDRVAARVQGPLSAVKQVLTGAYFTHEYSIQAAALFNPSIVEHPDQSEIEEGALRFVLSLRAVGEGHISSLAFQAGKIDAAGAITLETAFSKLSTGQHIPIAGAPEEDYDVSFPTDIPLSSRVVFPYAASEANGIEDVRFVEFREGPHSRFIGTYTAYSGKAIEPRLIETADFKNFHIRALHGKAVSDKGMALFPERIGNRYVMIGRQGGRSLSIMYSDDLYHWDDFQPLQQPRRGWEMLQIGNCGSPVKTPQGWLLLTHAVGPMRKYVLSMTLLELENPARVIASLEQPLLSPNAEEREGYVPNVLYSCGMLLHGDMLVIPYAMSDSAISFATVELEAVLKTLTK